MARAEESKDSGLDQLPEDLLERIRPLAPPESVEAVARHDLDGRGMYAEGYLILSDGRLGHFRPRDGSWDGRWHRIDELTGATIVEGLGMSVLQLLSDGSVVEEYRFTLRHAKEVARLHRRLERRIEGKEEEEPPPEKAKLEEKKIRCDKCGRVIPPWSEICPACLCRRKVLSRLLDFTRPYKWRVLTGFLLAILVTVAGLARPYLASRCSTAAWDWPAANRPTTTC